MYRFFLCHVVFLFCCTSSLLFGQELKPSESKVNLLPLPEWTKNIVFDTHAYEWFTDGNISNKLTPAPGGINMVTKKSYNTDSNLYIVGGETGYRVGLPFLQRITAGVETAEGDSGSMHARGEEYDPVSDTWDSARFGGWDASRYFRASIFYRPLEGNLAKDVSGFFDILGEWIKYKDRMSYGALWEDPATALDEPVTMYENYRYEGGGIGFRGGLGFFDIVSLKGQFIWYPDLSAKWSRRLVEDDGGGEQNGSAHGSDDRGTSFRVTMGFTPFKERKNLEIEWGYQYMEFKQNGGRFGNVDKNGMASTAEWRRTSNYREGLFVGGTVRW